MHRVSYLLLLAVFGVNHAVRWEAGTCPNLEDRPRFLPGQNLMLRYWYERKSFNNFLFSDEGKCTTLYNSFEHGVFSSMYQQINDKNETDLTYGMENTLDDPNFMQKKIFHLKFFGNSIQPIELPAIIIATDQVHYAVVYTCQQLTDPDSQETKKLESAWVHTAERGDTNYDEQIKRDLEAVGLEYESFKVTDQSNCSSEGNISWSEKSRFSH